MINILPIKHISLEEKDIFGEEIISLSLLARLDFPIPSGVAISLQFSRLPIILQGNQKDLLKKEVEKLLNFQNFKKELGNNRRFYFSGKIYKDQKTLYQEVVNIWSDELYVKILKEEKIKNLHPKIIFFIDSFDQQFSAYYDIKLKDTVTKSEIRILPKLLKEVDELVILANKQLAFPFVYHLITSGSKLMLVNINHFTESYLTPKIEVVKKEPKKVDSKSAVKVFFNTSGSLGGIANLDGVLLSGENFENVEKLAVKIVEITSMLPFTPLLFKLPIYKKDIKGSLFLLHQKNLLKQYVTTFLDARHKKQLLNIEMVIPLVRSKDEFLQMKRELVSLGVNRKGSLKLWLEIETPENILNAEDYLESGLDGVILNLDNLQSLLGGFDSIEREFYKNNIKGLLKFIEPALRNLHKAQIPVLAFGAVALYADVLDFLVEKGIYGIIVNHIHDADSLSANLRWVEKRIVTRNFPVLS